MNDRELLEFIAAQVGNLTRDVADVKTDMSNVKNDMSEMKNRLGKIENTLENVTNKKIDIALEGYSSNTAKLDEIDSKIENMAADVTNIEIITSKNWNDIATLKKAK
jgi:archaellum component FlaC